MATAHDVSNLTIVLVAAGGTAAGAVIGSVLSGIVNRSLALDALKRRARVGAVLVQRDLAISASYLKEIQEDERWWDFYDLTLPAFDRYEDALAYKLTPDDVEVVTQSVIELTGLSTKMNQVPREPGKPYVMLGDRALTGIGNMRANATAAYNTLSKLGGQKPVTGLLHE